MLIITMLLVCIGLFSLMSLMALLWIKLDEKRLKDQTDYITRLNNGEVLSKDNIFKGGEWNGKKLIYRLYELYEYWRI